MIHGHINDMIEAMDQVAEGFTIATYQGSDHAVWIQGNRGAFDRRDRTHVGVAAGLDELPDVRPCGNGNCPTLTCHTFRERFETFAMHNSITCPKLGHLIETRIGLPKRAEMGRAVIFKVPFQGLA
jgi:hypothetical protein